MGPSGWHPFMLIFCAPLMLCLLKNMSSFPHRMNDTTRKLHDWPSKFSALHMQTVFYGRGCLNGKDSSPRCGASLFQDRAWVMWEINHIFKWNIRWLCSGTVWKPAMNTESQSDGLLVPWCPQGISRQSKVTTMTFRHIKTANWFCLRNYECSIVLHSHCLFALSFCTLNYEDNLLV